MKKKIKTITFSNAQNYGAVLQAYALQEILEKNGYAVEIINYKDRIIGEQYKIIKFNKNIISSLIKNIVFFPINIKRAKSFKNFEKKSLKLTKEIFKTENELKENAPLADVYIAGSDQIWNSNTTLGLKDSYTLNFGDSKIKRISYAASIGNSEISENEKNIYIEKLKNIDCLSVREESAKDILLPLIKKDINVVLDPTLLLTRDEWEKCINEYEIPKEKEKYILAYVVQPDQEYVNIVNELSEKENLKVIHFSKTNKGIKRVRKRAYTVGPIEFLKLIKDAEYVVCTSFHATVFSILFNKNFFVVPHRKTGSRVTNLLKKLKLEDRAVNSVNDFKKMNFSKIDYNKVEKILDEERRKSLEWLQKNIEQ